MVFNTTIFIFFFLPIVVLINYLLKSTRARYVFLLLASLVFFAWAQPQYLWVLAISVIVTYIGGLLCDDAKGVKTSGDGELSSAHGARKLFFVVAILVNVALLFYFKYFNFTLETLSAITKHDFTLKNIILPLGISFFTFSEISYLADVYTGKVRCERNFIDFALYVLFFPKLIQGPIVRYVDMKADLKLNSKQFVQSSLHSNTTIGLQSNQQSNSSITSTTAQKFSQQSNSDTALSGVSYQRIATGLRRFSIGLVKKAVIADTLAIMVDGIWQAGTSQNTMPIAWLGSIAYTLQLYYDFSGYTDMAIGIGHMLGFTLNENFDMPYIAKSITEFWRRWHITLSSWFRDYIYIPLGGNRHAVYRNLAIVFLLTGVWHGSAWRYIFWGAFHGVFMLIERIAKKRNKNIFNSWICHIYLLFVVNLGWVIFRAPSLRDGLVYISQMFGFRESSMPGFTLAWYLDGFTLFIIIVAIIFCTTIPKNLMNWFENRMDTNDGTRTIYAAIVDIVCLIMLFVGIMFVVSGAYSSFIYFQF